MKMWDGRFSKALDSRVNDFNSSIRFDCRMYREDITGSMAHAAMLGKCDIIEQSEADLIIKTLGEILADIDEGRLGFDPEAEDIHMFVESELTARIGETGKRLHTSRSRNDQVALDIRMYLMREIGEIDALVRKLLGVIADKAEANIDTVMPGYTHLQRAQPLTMAHYLLAYAQMFMRDCGGLPKSRHIPMSCRSARARLPPPPTPLIALLSLNIWAFLPSPITASMVSPTATLSLSWPQPCR